MGGDLDGTSWILVSYDRRGVLTDVAGGQRVTAVFRAGSVSGTAGCNRYTATCDTSGSSIAIGQAITTLMACPEPAMEMEGAYLANLGRAATCTAAPDGLTVYGRDGERILLFRIDRADPITTGTFHVTSLNNGKGGVESVPGEVGLTATFGMDGAAGGFAGCNRFRGPYAIHERTIAIGPLATTRMFCGDAAMAIEQMYLAALEAAATFEFSSRDLELRDANGATQVDFVRT